MARRTKCRRVSFLPSVTYFKPPGIPVKCLKEVALSLEEVEALRLRDIEGLEQEQGSREMKVSRPTFQRILASAHHKIADALLNGKSVRIEGGHFELSPKRFRCSEGHEWEEAQIDSDYSVFPHLCPTCQTASIEQLSPAESECPYKGRSSCCLKCPLGVSDKKKSAVTRS
jgi:uncharacterized protein